MRLLAVLVLGLGLIVTVSASANVGARAGAASATVSVSPRTGPPTSRATASGSGFVPGEQVELSLDGLDLALVSVDAAGGFSGAAITIPATASPGSHVLAAVGRTSGASAQAPFVVRANWPTFRGGPGHAGSSPTENVLSAANVSGLRLAWSVPGGQSTWSSPVVANGIVYVISEGERNQHHRHGLLYAYDAATGATRWVKDLKPTDPNGNTDYSTPTVANGLVYALAGDYELWAFGARDGRTVWTFSDGAGSCCALGSPLAANGLVYFSSHDGTLYALNAVSGARVWSAAPT
jgi:outer membrane protein assembly factor BamB